MPGPAVHVAEAVGGAEVGEEAEELVEGLAEASGPGPEDVPVADVGGGVRLLCVDEAGEFGWVTNEEDGRVVEHPVEDALLGAELDREATRVSRHVGGPAHAAHGAEADRHGRARALLEDVGGGVAGGKVGGGFEVAVGAGAAGMYDSF